MGQYDGQPERVRRILGQVEGLSDIGGGKSVLEVDDELVDRCRAAHEFTADAIRRSIAMVQNMKDNGNEDFDEAWAAFIQVSKTLPTLHDGAFVLLCFLITEQVYGAGQAG